MTLYSKIPGSNGTSEKVVLFFRTKYSKRRSVLHLLKLIFDTSFRRGRGGGGGKRRGQGPRKDVLTTCKAVTQRGGQRISTVFFPQWIFFDFLEARIAANRQRKSEMLKKLKKKNISFIFVFLAYRICLSVLKCGGKLKRNRARS